MTLDLATKLVEEWAFGRGTKPEPAERDLALWIVERFIPDAKKILEAHEEVRGSRKALGSWAGAPE